MRTALLAAVSHDLRTPLASAKAAVTSLRSTEVEFDAPRPRRAAGHRGGVAGQAGPAGRQPAGHEPPASRRARASSLRPIGLEDAVPHALDEIGGAAPGGAHADRVPTFPRCSADPGLLERVLVNLIANALRFSPPGRAAAAGRQRTRRPGRAARHRSRAGHPRGAVGRRLPAVPAARRPGQHHRCRPWTRAGPRLDRGDGRHPDPGGHPRRRSDHGACRWNRRKEAVHDQGPGRRRRAADPARPADQPACPRLRRRDRRRRRPPR